MTKRPAHPSGTHPKQEKTQVFTEIDKILIPIAKGKYKPSYGITFDDFLQDLRLKFVEYVEKRRNGNRSIPYNSFETDKFSTYAIVYKSR